MSDRAELFRALGALAEAPDPRHVAIASALGIPGRPAPGEFTEVFLFQVYPYASAYLGEDGLLGGEARDRVAGFWRALGFVPPPEPDHVAALLGLYGALVNAELDERDPARQALRRASREALLWEHLLCWLPAYLGKVEEVAPPYYAAWARLVADALVEEASRLGHQARLPLQLRAAPPLPDPESPADAWLAALLAAVRSGMILTRRDLRRGSHELGIGSRVAERAYMLRAMFDQDAVGTAQWLAREARRAAARHRAMEPDLGRIAAFWGDRAEASATALELASVGAGVPADDRVGAVATSVQAG
jgi:TorA maturation chaperone TorD